MNKKDLYLFITDIEALYNDVNDKDIKLHLCKEFQNIKEKHIVKNARSKQNTYEEVEKMLYNNRRETPEVVSINIEEFKAQSQPAWDVFKTSQIGMFHFALKQDVF